MLAYATTAQLQAYRITPGVALPDDLDEQERLLDRASELIADHAVSGYGVTETGAPSDPDVAAALADATCAQVEQWLEVGEENDVSGYPSNTFVSGGGLSVNRLPPRLAPRAARALDRVGLRRAWAW